MLKGSKGSFLSFRQIIPQYDGIPEVPQQRSSQVPQLIWSLWDTGIENAPTMQSTCLWSQRAANPTFEARQLDLQSAINMTNVLSLISKDSWDNMTIQAKSDVIRVVLLHKYGGVWADATLCMVEGLERWLRMDTDFTTFIRHDKKATESKIRPWMSSWFMVSRPGGVVITALLDAVIKFWNESKERRPVAYFWIHELFSNIMSSNSTAIRDAFDHRTAISADPFHCIGTDPPMLPEDLPMFKIESCNKKLRASVLKRIRDLYGDPKEITHVHVQRQ